LSGSWIPNFAEKMMQSAKEEALKLTSFQRELPQILLIDLPTAGFSAKAFAGFPPTNSNYGTNRVARFENMESLSIAVGFN
jgi:hypothetical protein